MSDERWFRNTTWNKTIAEAFEQKLKRARHKAQYLRIQACTIAPRHPRVALDLLERYFAMGDDLFHAQAHVDRATAYLVLGEVEAAIRCYEAALDREAIFPDARTTAYLDLPYVIALHGVVNRFDQAMTALAAAGDRLMFPVERFKYHAAKALLLADTDQDLAHAEAANALSAASLDHSGFRFHPKVGLVSAVHDLALARLRGLGDA